MKKHILILAGSALILASCGSNNNENQQNEQAKMDSIAKANAALQDELNQKKNDSTINAMAAAKADSMANAAKAEESKKNNTKKTTKTTTKPATTKFATEDVAPVKAAPVKTAQDAKFNSRTNATKEITTEQKKAQDDKFNSRK